MTLDSSRTSPIKLGVIGCGAFAQLMHLRVLADLPGFELVALCDTSAAVVDGLGDRYGVKGRYSTVEDLLQHGGLEAVLVANRDHYQACVATLQAGKHLLVEKPLCLDPAEGRELVEIADAAGVVAMVAYMKRYDWCFEQLVQRVKQIGDPRLVRVHDFLCQFRLSYELYDLVRRADVPAAEKEAEAARMRESMTNAVGSDESVDLYRLLLMFASHDINALRGLLGEPRSVDAVHVSSAETIVAVLDYGLRGPALLELSAGTQYGWFEEEITVAGESNLLTLRFPHPYVQFGQSELTERSNDGVATHEGRVIGPQSDGFRRTWLRFAEAIATGRPPETTFRDGLADLELAVELTRRGTRAA